jgi:hypothetical protein
VAAFTQEPFLTKNIGFCGQRGTKVEIQGRDCGLPVSAAGRNRPTKFGRPSRGLVLGIFLSLVALTPAKHAFAADYYVSKQGDDGNSGVSEGSPWKSLWRVNQMSLSPGDRILLRGGDVFAGGLVLDQSDGGTPSKPVTIASYGIGRATISPGTGTGIRVYNAGGIVISRLRVLGSSADTSTGSGIYFFNYLPATKLDTLVIERVEVAGFKNGIEIGAWKETSGFKNVAIRNCSAHDNRENGITIWGYDVPSYTGYAHQNVYIGYCRAYGNSGESSVGNGIIVSNIDGGIIERSVAHHNGLKNKTSRGPVGIWAWRANNIVIRHNESYANSSNTGGSDGNGFNLDGGMTNSVLEYNYSHGNDGGGFVFAQYKDALPFRSNVIRYNISENDGRKNYFSGIFVWSADDYGITDSRIYNNTVYTTPSDDTLPGGIAVVSKTRNVSIQNNIIVTKGGMTLLSVVPGQVGTLIQGNAYWSSGAPFRIKWDSKYYSSLWSFRSAGLERIGDKSVGIDADPQLSDPGRGVTLDKARDLESLAGYKLKPSSPLLGKGLDLKSMFGVVVGERDFYGSRIPSDRQFEIGAHELVNRTQTADIGPN